MLLYECSQIRGLSFPKDIDFTLIADKQIVQAQEHLNHRPRKSLGNKTPF